MDRNAEKPAFTYAMFATSSQLAKLLDALKGFEEEWQSQGYEELSAKQAAERLSGRALFPEDWKTERPIAYVLGAPDFLQLLILLKEPAIGAAIELVLGGILHAFLRRIAAIFPTVANKRPDIKLPMRFCPSLWLEHHQVLITVVAVIESTAGFKMADLLIPEGLRRAGQWLGQHGVTHPYVTYYIWNGNLDTKPTLSLRPPEH